MLCLWYTYKICFFSTGGLILFPTPRPIKDIRTIVLFQSINPYWLSCPHRDLRPFLITLLRTRTLKIATSVSTLEKLLCLPLLLHSSWSLSLLILCIQNHPRAKIHFLVLEPPTKVKPPDGFNVLHTDVDLQRVRKHTPSSHAFRNYEHSRKMRGETSERV